MDIPIVLRSSGPAAFQGLPPGRSDNVVAVTPDVEVLLDKHVPVCCSVSGGKDSDAMAIAVSRYLDKIGHQGPRLLVHADLGRVEWRDSLPSCERLAARLGWELLVVRRQAGDMLARWQKRWANNVARYAELSCVKLILPWSTPAMRFCTSELKGAVIAAALKKRFPDQDIVDVTGIRRQESENRRRMPISAPNSRLARRDHIGLTWNPIIEWPVEDVLATIADAGLALHEAYRSYGSSRVSCVLCIMSSIPDLNASVSCPDNLDVYRMMVELEADSTFAFQGNRWLADLAPQHLSEDLRERARQAKAKAEQRVAIEAEIPKHLLYVSGWPTGMPTRAEAELIADVRRRVSQIMGINAQCLTAEDVLERYADLLAKKAIAATKKRSRSGKTAARQRAGSKRRAQTEEV